MLFSNNFSQKMFFCKFLILALYCVLQNIFFMPQYCTELRKAALEHYKKNNNVAQTCKVFSISPKSIKRWTTKLEKGKGLKS